MITLSDAALRALTASFTYHVRAESWLGDQLLAEEIPISSGFEDGDRSLRVPERVTLTVPRIALGTDWTPIAADSPLAAYGQRIKVELGIGLGGASEIEWFQRGWFVIYSSAVTGDTIRVDCRGLLHLIDEARLVSPYQPTGTILATLQGLLEPTLTVINDGVEDRSVPADINYDEDRLGAVFELLSGWPADGQVTPSGFFSVNPIAEVDVATGVTITDGEGGTAVQVVGTSTRESTWNVVVARGTATSGAQVQGVDFLDRGPKRYGTDFNPQPIPYFFSSPLITTVDQATEAARTTLIRLSRLAGQTYSVQMVPHPALLLGDVVSIVSDAYTGDAVIEAYSLPYTPSDGAMSLTLRALE